MKFVALVSLTFAAAKVFAADPFAEGVRPTDPLTPEEQQKTFRLPPGFEVQLVAAEPELRKPMNMAFDGAGRLWITESREYPWPTNTSPRDTIRIFSEFDANGRARKITTFATNLNIPIGIHPFLSPASNNNGLTWKCIAWSIPNIWLFEDTDGDGVADKKEKLLGPFDYERDTHGNQASFRRGLDGWIYATHGYNNRSRVSGKDGQEIFMSSGNTYRFRIDGSHIERWSHGQVNPFGLTFDALGNLYSADCHSSPIYQLLRGAWYPSFGAPDDGLGFAPTTIQHSHGSTAICGITMLDDESWPEEFRGNLIVGNVMTSRINRDRIEWRGSTSVGHELPDLVTVTDPWFRPVDLQLGPDGALWVADFYNRIIGHYEVPLTHPGRDRERGRLWRITPPAQRAAGVPLANSLTLSTNLDVLLSELASPNRPRRTLAMNLIADRIGKPAVPALQRAVKNPANSFQAVHALWLLRRFDALSAEDLREAAQAKDSLVRVHAQRIAADVLQQASSPGLMMANTDLISDAYAAALNGLKDRDPLVERCAAEAVARHRVLDTQPVAALLELRARVPMTDNHLLYAVRAALRDQLQDERVFRRVLGEKWSEQDSRAIADVVPAVTNSAAAAFAVAHLQKYSEPRDTATKCLKHAARFLPEERIDDLASLARDKFGDDIDLQSALFKSVHEGLNQRGTRLSLRMSMWGSALANDLLSSVRRTDSEWIYLPIEGLPGSANPWVVQSRPSADGRMADFLSSLPQGEQLTGILRSTTFIAPKQLSFFIAGHDGYPDKAAQKKNFVQLRDADSYDVLVQTPAPRHDTAQRVAWDLQKHAGKQVFLELVDGDTAGAYAWLAAGRFEPAIIALPKITPRLVDERVQAAAQIALAVRDSSLESHLSAALKMSAGAEARGAVASTLLALNSRAHLAECGEILTDLNQPLALRQRMAQAITESNLEEGQALVIEALRGSPERFQSKLAVALASTRVGAEALLREVETGKLSARVLQDRAVREKVLAARPTNARERLAEATKNLTPLNEQVQKMISDRGRSFKTTTASAARGVAVFEKNCAACHQIDGKGAVIGPQLDGIGTRGAERIMEDILDPNRNVDPAFRATLFELNDGDVLSGLFRREEGEVVIYAETTGKELSVPKKNIKERRQSELSLMPDNFADTIASNDFNDLIAFLLANTGAKK